MSVKELFSDLNDRQRQAVETTKGPVLVLAGPGSGKTKVVTSRIAYLLEQGVAPSEILAITFTKKAAEEMRERVAEILGNMPRGLTICTFHSLGFRMLRDNAALAGLETPFEIVSDKQQKEIAKAICQELKEDSDIADTLREISKAKNLGLSPAELRSLANSDQRQFIADVYERYEAALREKNAVDLDDLILRTLRGVLQADVSIAAAYQRRYRYIMVDEYQDTNGPQYEMTKCLLPAKRNLCVVGDDDQSIYGFRGSNVEHILNFADDFPGYAARLQVSAEFPAECSRS